jgi:hypothetical protein
MTCHPKQDDPVKSRWQPKLLTLNQKDNHCADGRTLLFEVYAICEAIKQGWIEWLTKPWV